MDIVSNFENIHNSKKILLNLAANIFFRVYCSEDKRKKRDIGHFVIFLRIALPVLQLKKQGEKLLLTGVNRNVWQAIGADKRRLAIWQ